MVTKRTLVVVFGAGACILGALVLPAAGSGQQSLTSGLMVSNQVADPGASAHWQDSSPAVCPTEVDRFLKNLGTEPDWSRTSTQPDGGFGSSVASAGDVNCDGFDDVIIGAPFYDAPSSNEGLAVVFYGSLTGLHSGPVDWWQIGDQIPDYFGYTVASAGDVNQDGCADVIVGARNYTNAYSREGAAFVYHGSPSGLSVVPDNVDYGGHTAAYFGTAVGSAGDVNGDGYDDVFVTAKQLDNPEDAEGGIWVWHGSPSGISSLHDWRAESNNEGAFLGSSAASAGDVNGDGYDDIIVGSPSYDAGGTETTTVWVWHGSAVGLNNGVNGVPCNADWSQEGLGWVVSGAGDVNADGYDDVILGYPEYSNGQEGEGAAWIFHGSAAGLDASAANKDEGNQIGANFGRSVAGAGDVNNDGYDDVMVGAPYFDDEGKVWIWYGSATGISTSADWGWKCSVTGAELGWSVASAGDINDDGFDDVILGAPELDDNGAAIVFIGPSQQVFVDDFEAGNTSRWSDTAP